ncbi:MAG: hypothetical protein KAU10_09505, partial [Dehalococcoidia bacterium]|nr:hypothetical protein [Dehalococcoidia bacterium]
SFAIYTPRIVSLIKVQNLFPTRSAISLWLKVIYIVIASPGQSPIPPTARLAALSVRIIPVVYLFYVASRKVASV